jgi:hypothetical protein
MILVGALLSVSPSSVEAVPSESKKSTPPKDQTYVGAKECGSCHVKEFAAWQKTGHSRAFGVLTEKYEKDPKCLGCHTTGYKRPSGYKDASDADLKGVTCEVCHGPGSKHVDICKAYGDKELTHEEEELAEHSIYEVLPKNICIKCHERIAHGESKTPEELRHKKKH